MRHFRYIRHGLTNHPGILPLLAFVLMGALAGRGSHYITSPVRGMLMGASVMLATFGPFVIFSAWEAGRDAERAKDSESCPTRP